LLVVVVWDAWDRRLLLRILFPHHHIVQVANSGNVK